MLDSASPSPQYLTELGFEVEWSDSEDVFLQDRR